MVTNGSIDSMEKSTFNSSIEDNQSYDIFEAHNPNPTGFSSYAPTTHEYTNPIPKEKEKPKQTQNQYMTPGSFGLSYKNEGYRDNSTFASKNNSAFQSRSESIQEGNLLNEETPIIHSSLDAQDDNYASDYYNQDTLPLNSSLKGENTHDYKDKYGYDPHKLDFLIELKSKVPKNNENLDETSYLDLPSPPEPPKNHYAESQYPNNHYAETQYPKNDLTPSDYSSIGLPSTSNVDNYNNYPYYPDYNTVGLIEPVVNEYETPKMPKSRSKSEALLETNFDCDVMDDEVPFNQPLDYGNRSKSQPLETAM